MTRNKHFRSVFAALLCAVLCMTAFATVAYADGGDYYDDELPPETWQEETQPEDNTIVPGTPFTEDGITATRDLLYDKHTNKQFITVETRNGHTLYIVIDYDKLLDEEEERYQTYFLNPVDEADLMALLEDDSQNTPVVCSCAEKMYRWQGQYELRPLQNGYDELCRKGSDAGGNRTARRADPGEEKQYGRHPDPCADPCCG